MIKRGFTIAEVLVTLGIIGVISAMTIPTFVGNVENKANAAKLSSLITDVQTAFNSMITSEAVLDMEETEFAQETTLAGRKGKLSNYLKVADSSNTLSAFYSENITHLGGRTVANPACNDIYQTKNGELLIYEISSLTGSSNVVDGAMGYLSLDVNGGAKPNVWGRDVFKFILGNDGNLYPAGGSVYEDVTSDKTLGCTSGNSIGCADKLIKDGFKVNY